MGPEFNLIEDWVVYTSEQVVEEVGDISNERSLAFFPIVVLFSHPSPALILQHVVATESVS